MTTVDVLRKARGLYAASPSHALPDDIPKPGTDCVLTALNKVVCDDSGRSLENYEAASDALVAAFGTDRLVEFNAEHSTEEVLAVFDKAIEAVA